MATPARQINNSATPMTISTKLTPQYYPTRNRLAQGRSPAGHRAAVGLHGGQRLLPRAPRGLQPVPVERELVHQLVHRRGVVRDTVWACHDQHLPVLDFLDVLDRLLEAGLVVEEGARGFEVLVAGHDLVAVLGGVRLAGRPLLFAGGRLSGWVRADVEGGSGH